MQRITDEQRKALDAARERLNLVDMKIHIATKPFQKERYEAKEALEELEDGLPEHLGTCESCDAQIYEGDPHHYSDGCYLCSEHSPMLSDAIRFMEQLLIDEGDTAFIAYEMGDQDEFTSYLAGLKFAIKEHGDYSLAT